MDPLQAQRQHSPAGNLYPFPGQQDDFSTPFNDTSSFSDPNALFNQNFNQSFTTDFQNSSENVTDQGFQQSMNEQNQYGSFMPAQADGAGWTGNHAYLDAGPYGFNNIGQQNFSNNPYGQQRMNTYGQDVNMNFPFPNRTYNPPQVTQRSATISPAVIEQSDQTIPPSALQASDDIWQTPMEVTGDSNLGAPQSVSSANKRATSSPQPAVSRLVPMVVVPTPPSKATHSHEELQAGIPEGVVKDGFHTRRAEDFTGKAASAAVKGWIYLSKETFETNESRLASLPEAPARSSINQLRAKLSSSEAAKLHPGAKAKLEEKLNKREKKVKSKKKKERSLLPKAAKLSAKTASAGVQRPGADGTGESESEDSTDSSDYESGSDYDGDSDREDELPPLPKLKPKDPVESRKYEVIEAVWAPSYKRLAADALKARFGPWLENLQRARKEWKTATTVAERTEKKKLLEEMIRLTTQHGHSNFVESIDQLPPLATLVAASVTELIKAERYDDSLMQAIILMFLKISVIKWSFLLQTRLNKLVPRVVKNAKGNIKAAAELLMDKINRSEKESSVADKKTGEGATGAVKIEDTSDIGISAVTIKDKGNADVKKSTPPGSDLKSAISLSGVKKATTAPSDVKKALAVAVQKKPSPSAPGRTTSGSLSKALPMARAGSAEGSTNKTANSSTTATTGREKERVRHVVTKPPSIFSSISASKRPGAASAASKAPVKDVKPAPKPVPKPAPKPEIKAPPTRAPAAPVFSFAETLASIGKPKEEAKPKKDVVDNKPPETEEEKKKRLRKESRRHLRVTWPTDEQLCQIRLFDHGLEDEIAHEAAEVADLKDEGRAFKREYRQQHNKMVDFEQDFIKESDDVLDPEPTDFSGIEEAQTKTNVETRANGHKAVESAEAAEQQKREQSVIIAIYATQQDLPYTPREPPADSWTQAAQQCDFGDPPVWIKNRSAAEMERLQRGAKTQSNSNVTDLLKNLSQFSQPQAGQATQTTQAHQQQAFTGASSSVQSLLAQLANPQQSQQQAVPAPTQANSYDPQAAINLFMSMQGNQNQTPSDPTPAPQPAPAAPAAPDLSSILGNLAALSGQAPNRQQSAPAAPQQQVQQQTSAAPGVDPDILAFLSQYNSSGSQNPQQPIQQNQGQVNLLSLLGQQQPTGPQNSAQAFNAQWVQQQNNANANANDRKRGHNEEGANGGQKKRKYAGEPVVQCKYWKLGKCHYGDSCTFLHD